MPHYNRSVTYLLLFLIISACNNSGSKRILEQKSTRNSGGIQAQAEFYCWCFISDELRKVKGHVEKSGRACETSVTIRPVDLIKPEYLIFTTDEREKIKSLRHLIFDGKSKCDTGEYKADTRLEIVFRNSTKSNDTVTYSTDFRVIVNEKYLFEYRFNVMDSLRTLINKDKIDCQSSK